MRGQSYSFIRSHIVNTRVQQNNKVPQHEVTFSWTENVLSVRIEFTYRPAFGQMRWEIGLLSKLISCCQLIITTWPSVFNAETFMTGNETLLQLKTTVCKISKWSHLPHTPYSEHEQPKSHWAPSLICCYNLMLTLSVISDQISDVALSRIQLVTSRSEVIRQYLQQTWHRGSELMSDFTQMTEDHITWQFVQRVCVNTHIQCFHMTEESPLLLCTEVISFFIKLTQTVRGAEIIPEQLSLVQTVSGNNYPERHLNDDDTSNPFKTFILSIIIEF